MIELIVIIVGIAVLSKASDDASRSSSPFTFMESLGTSFFKMIAILFIGACCIFAFPLNIIVLFFVLAYLDEKKR